MSREQARERVNFIPFQLGHQDEVSRVINHGNNSYSNKSRKEKGPHNFTMFFFLFPPSFYFHFPHTSNIPRFSQAKYPIVTVTAIAYQASAPVHVASRDASARKLIVQIQAARVMATAPKVFVFARR